MYLPRGLISHLYNHLVRNTHPLSPPVLILVSLSPDALCACHIFSALLKRAYIPHKIQPVAGYNDLAKAGQDLITPLTRNNGGDGGVVVCLGVGGLVDLEEVLGLEQGDDETADVIDHGVEVWVVDARRPWNLQNVFGTGPIPDLGNEALHDAPRQRRGVERGKLLPSYTPGHGAIIVFDDGDIEQDLAAESEAFAALQEMPPTGDDDAEESDGSVDSDDDDTQDLAQTRKRKTDDDDEANSDLEADLDRPRQRRRSNSGSAIAASSRDSAGRSPPIHNSEHPNSSQHDQHSLHTTSRLRDRQPSSKTLRRRLLRLRRRHEATLQAYYALGTSYSEPISSIMYSLASDLGIEDVESLWLAIVGVTSLELYASQVSTTTSRRGDWTSNRQERIRQVLRDEVRRLTPVAASEAYRERDVVEDNGVIPTNGRSPSDTAIRLSPEPRFLLIRHWSLYDSMLHSPYLSCRLHVWSDGGRKRLDNLLTKMGVSLNEARKGYTHMDIEIKRGLRQRLLKFAPRYALDDLVPPADTERYDKEGWGFVRCWGWKACLSAHDVAVIVGAILEVGADANIFDASLSTSHDRKDSGRVVVSGSYSSRVRALPTPDASPNNGTEENLLAADPDWTTHRFFAAYDALCPTTSGLSKLLSHLDTAKHLHRAILRTGCALVGKHQIRHLRAFRMGVVKEGPDVSTFVHPGALVKLASWVLEAVGVLEAEKGAKERGALVLGTLDQDRGVYVVVGLGGGSAGHNMRSRAEQKAREARRAARQVEKKAKALTRERIREERRIAKRERDEANGVFRDEGDDEEESESEQESSADDSDESQDEATTSRRAARGYGLNKFGAAFQQVVQETNARVRIDSFEHAVVEVQKEDFGAFLEALSLKSVVG